MTGHPSLVTGDRSVTPFSVKSFVRKNTKKFAENAVTVMSPDTNLSPGQPQPPAPRPKPRARDPRPAPPKPKPPNVKRTRTGYP